MAYSYKGSISFGLVFIPIKLEKCVRPNEISFNQIDKRTNSRISYIKSCRECDGKEVPASDIVRAYQYEKDRYVVFDDDDFEKIKSKKDKTINIEQFVDLKEIDPIFFDTSYYVVPTGAEKAYSLLLKVMEAHKKVGIAKTVLGTKEVLVALRVRGGEMLLSTLFFKSEIKKNPAGDVVEKLDEKELSLAKMLVENMTAAFKPENYKDEYTERVMKAIEFKKQGKKIIAPKEEVKSISNLMEALKKSVENMKTPKPKKAAQ